MNTPAASDRDAHFIGWLPMPAAFARFLRPVAVVSVVAAVALAALFAGGQASPGPARWDDDAVTTLDGVAYAEPYAMVRVSTAVGPRTVLLVDEGKHGATGRLRAFDGRPVRVTGTLLSRDDRRMLELAPGDDGVQPLAMPPEQEAALRRGPAVSRGRAELRGEVVDAKCYLGAMKPGGGRTHRGCAALCLRGGVPPLFAFRDAAGKPGYALMVNAAGGPIDPPWIEQAGVTLVLVADLETWGDLLVARPVTPAAVPVRP